MNLSFAGTSDFAAVVLNALLQSPQHKIKQVYTQPDRPAGRGRRTRPSPIKHIAQQFTIPVKQPASAAEFAQKSDLNGVDALIVVAYGLILPAPVLSLPRYGCINVHGSLLPRWRGAAPVQRALQAGDRETGITIMLMERGIDTGKILLQKPCAIGSGDTSFSLSARLASTAGECLLEALDRLASGPVKLREQDASCATYAHKVTKQEADIDWNTGAAQLERNIRAFNPTPVAHTCLNNVKIRVWAATTLDFGVTNSEPGAIIAYSPAGLDISTGNQALRILTLQLDGKKKQSIKEIYNGYPGLFVPGK